MWQNIFDETKIPKNKKKVNAIARNLKQFWTGYAAKFRTSMGMCNDQKYGKSIMTSHENSDRD